jgi:hypothetical protein
MSCCGNKRKLWLNETKSSTHQKTIAVSSSSSIADKPGKVFEYTGNYSLTINGVASGKSYYFKFKGDKIIVDYYDSFAMMAERDLKVSVASEYSK